MSKVIENRELRFVCPKCGYDHLYFRQEVIGEVWGIYRNGEIRMGDEFPEDLLGFQCARCGYEIADDNGRITDTESLAEWLINNCPQEGRSTGADSTEPEQT
jgi:predicted RNA-binding Zn-ribbon protein involved in translation (DUF1610 family)